ncbi:HlyD family type I secretion periplasmic adaptor subunit [Dulcicalothrix desertica PCC 7102]|uniref:HlyD family type I secretion periplasmic adaptor subunit n=1 Tax=Dulcicalothrix desertica PCC 7102 TaxID=232991 RepID=A0A433VUA5_9CYAN|nr:HlyD family efflux transporter periplasmic adaptor subunit [Dulcicalothrix desertica]RUT09684.1 HlyD family type I secretion periplasmic adaptor subunit [Dulcicalothrix desertica PCC 7102]TWH50880.1 Multidrug resistance efflux pump [Dulcicalothrix desertica PCC 7102]
MLTHEASIPVEQNFLPPIKRWTQFGGIFILTVLSLTIPIASFAKYKVTVKAQATIRPAGELRIVQSATEGQVMHISVQENQIVKKGDIIATIDDSRLQTKKSQLQSNLQQSKLQLVQINAQINAMGNQIRAETERITRTIASAEAELSGRTREFRDKNLTTVAEVQEADANIGIAREELHKGYADLKSVHSTFYATQAILAAARTKRERYESVAKEGAISKNQLEETQLAVSQQEQAVEAQKALIESQKQTIKRLEQAVLAARARKQRAQAILNPSNSEVGIAQQRIAQEKATLKANFAALSKERQALIHQKIDIQKQLERDSRELIQVETDIKQTVIAAPADGTIFKLVLRNSTQTVRAGEEIAHIAPNNSNVVVKAIVDSQDVSKVKIGQKVNLRVSACPYPDYGTLNGKVKAISPDAITPQANGTQTGAIATTQKPGVGATFYEVTVEPNSLILGKGKNKCSIQLGMEGRADIISREDNALQFFLRKAKLITDI